ncbi:hypothetical protein GCM10027360_69820 [Amycolatopsis echigonensis]
MTTTRWKPRGRIGIRPRRKASSAPVGDDALPDFRTLDEPSSDRSPGFDATVGQHRAADNELAALPDEIDTRHDLSDAADRRGENARRRSAANPSADSRGTTDLDADQLPSKPEGGSSRRPLPADASVDRHGTATASAPSLPPVPRDGAVSHDQLSDADANRHESATSDGQLAPSEIARHRLNAPANTLRPLPATGDAELSRPDATSGRASRHSTANPNEARHEAATDPELLPSKPANSTAAVAAHQPRAATDLEAGPAHDEPHANPAPVDVADNQPNHSGDRIARRREMGGHAAWYLAAGVVTTGLQAVLFLAFRPEIGAQWANLVALAITTVGNTEFHRRITFADRTSRAGKRHLQDLVTFAFYAGYGSLVLAALDAVVTHPSAGQQTAALLAASFVGGVVRFAVLRWWVFARARRTDALQDHER